MKINSIHNTFAPITNTKHGTWYPMDFAPTLGKAENPLGEGISEDVLVAVTVDGHHFYSPACWCVVDGIPKIDFTQAENPEYSQEELEACAVAWMVYPPMPAERITQPVHMPLE